MRESPGPPADGEENGDRSQVLGFGHGAAVTPAFTHDKHDSSLGLKGGRGVGR